jgi:hypothetical protein
MFDYAPTLIEKLDEILPTYPDTINQKVATPCITWFLYNDTQQETGDTLHYSYISYCVKVWGTSLAEVMKYSVEVDEMMRESGFTRVNSNILQDSVLFCNTFIYRGHGKEFLDTV